MPQQLFRLLTFIFTAKRLRPRAQGCFNPWVNSPPIVPTPTGLRPDGEASCLAGIRKLANCSQP
jgi:hypothetical protein